MIVINIIIGYLISVGLSIISDILIILLIDNYSKKRLKNAETIREFFSVLCPCCWIPIINVAYCFSNILLGSLALLYGLCKLIKLLNILWNKFLNIKISKNNK